MKYAQITLTVAFPDYSEDDTISALDYVFPTLLELPPEVHMLDVDERPMVLLVDYSAEKGDS